MPRTGRPRQIHQQDQFSPSAAVRLGVKPKLGDYGPRWPQRHASTRSALAISTTARVEQIGGLRIARRSRVAAQARTQRRSTFDAIALRAPPGQVSVTSSRRTPDTRLKSGWEQRVAPEHVSDHALLASGTADTISTAHRAAGDDPLPGSPPDGSDSVKYHNRER